MSLTRRKVKALTRDRESYRDDRIFWVGTDDRYAPKQYLDFLRVPRVRIFALGAGDESQAAERVVARLRSEAEAQEQDEKWALLDADHYLEGTHLTSFSSALKQARDAGIQVAISKPCFEFWLLLHWVGTDVAAGITDAGEAEALLRRELGGYNKRKLKAEHYPMERVLAATRKARELDGTVAGGTIPQANTTRVYQLIEAIARSAHVKGMTAEWKALREELMLRTKEE